jgi:type I restriction enzyme M protein
MADPACGTAGFLIAAFNHILGQNTKPGPRHYRGDKLTPAQWKFLEEQAFTGFDNDANMVKIAILNLYLHGLDKANIQFFNPLTTSVSGGYPGQRYQCILANPPFAGKIQSESILADINLDTRNTELLFVKWIIDHLAPGGRAGVIVPNGVLFGSTNAARKVRELLLTECDLQAVVNLPSGVFKPYSGVGTAALIFEKRAEPIKRPEHPEPVEGAKGRGARASTSSARSDPAQGAHDASRKQAEPVEAFVWFYDLTADGFSLDDKRMPIDANDIPDVLGASPPGATSP